MNLRKKLFHPNYDKYNLLAQVKHKAKSLSSFNNLIKPALTHPFTQHVLKANPFPNKYSDVKKARQLPFTNNLIGEIGWILYGINKYQEKIGKFLIEKKDFDQNMILGNYKTANKNLDKIEDNFGISLWAIENRFLILEFKKGSEANWEYLSDISNKIENTLILFLCECYSKRAETNISYSRYVNFINSKVTNLQYEKLTEYFYFRLNYPSYKGYQSFPFFLSLESGFPLIDRYLLLKDILEEGILKQSSNQDFRQTLIFLEEKFNDYPLKQLLSVEDGIFKTFEKSEILHDTCNNYSKGKFSECLSYSLKCIKETPTAIEYYELYTKCLIELNREYKPTNISTIIDKILKNLYKVFSRQDDIQQAISNLLKISTQFHNTSWGKQIYGIVERYTRNTNLNADNSYLFSIHSQFNNPRILEIIKNTKAYNKYTRSFEETSQRPLCYLINKYTTDGNFNEIKRNNTIHPQRKYIYIARALEKAKEYLEIISHFNKPLEDFELTGLEKEERIRQLYKANLETNNLKEALKIYINNYLANNGFTSRLSKQVLFDLIEENDCIDLKNLIELPIFYALCSIPSYKKYVAYDTFLFEHDLQRPTEINNSLEIEKNKLIYFLNNVCTIELMQNSLAFEDQDDVEAERQEILRILIKIDNNNEDKYIKEIAELTQSENIRKAIREVNKGRITVNIPQLKNIESSNVQEGFSRYQELLKYSKANKDAKGVDVSINILQEYVDSLLDERQQDRKGITNDPAFISFKSMFTDLRDKFLLSKEYGLDGYLSTRIRHGTLENHIRSVFENHSLISERNTEGNYQDIDRWSSIIPRNLVGDLPKLQNKLKQFSKDIDSEIKYITNELIQVYTEKHNSKPKALFNYNFSNHYLWLQYKSVEENITNHDQFLDYVFIFLQRHTEISLKRIRKKFKEEIKEIFINKLNDLQQSVEKALTNKAFPSLNAAILKCRTKINDELDQISEWFYLSNPSTNLISDVATTLRTGVEITNSISPNRQVNPSYKEVVDLPLTGAEHVIYITRILLDNIIKHSGIKSRSIDVDISAELTENNLLRLSISNKLGEGVDIKGLNHILSTVKEKWRDKDNLEKINIEGGSGFNKIRRILAFDLKGKKYGFNFEIEEKKLLIIIDIHLIITRYESQKDHTN